MIKINYESDFKLTETTEEQRFADVPFKFVYATNSGTYMASYDGTTYTHCKPNSDHSVTVIFNNHGLGVGKLKVRREFFVPDRDFPDGVYNVVSNDTTDVILVEGKTEGFDVEDTFRPPYVVSEGSLVPIEVVDSLDSDASDKALSANQGRILNERINVVTTDVEEIDESIKDINETLEYANATIKENTNSITSNAEEINKTKANLDALEGVVAEKADASKVKQIETEVQKNTNAISNNTARLVVLEGDGEGSIKNAVAKGIAKVVANAPEDLDTLKEVADYIASDKTKANEIEKAISDLGAKNTQLENSINANATAILSKQPLLTGDEFKTIDGKSIMGEGNIDLPKVEIVNNLTTGGADKALSAEMGKELKGMIPTKTSELENDSGYLTEIPEGYATEDYVEEAITTLTKKVSGRFIDHIYKPNYSPTLSSLNPGDYFTTDLFDCVLTNFPKDTAGGKVSMFGQFNITRRKIVYQSNGTFKVVDTGELAHFQKVPMNVVSKSISETGIEIKALVNGSRYILEHSLNYANSRANAGVTDVYWSRTVLYYDMKAFTFKSVSYSTASDRPGTYGFTDIDTSSQVYIVMLTNNGNTRFNANSYFTWQYQQRVNDAKNAANFILENANEYNCNISKVESFLNSSYEFQDVIYASNPAIELTDYTNSYWVIGISSKDVGLTTLANVLFQGNPISFEASYGIYLISVNADASDFAITKFTGHIASWGYQKFIGPLQLGTGTYICFTHNSLHSDTNIPTEIIGRSKLSTKIIGVHYGGYNQTVKLMPVRANAKDIAFYNCSPGPMENVVDLVNCKFEFSESATGSSTYILNFSSATSMSGLVSIKNTEFIAHGRVYVFLILSANYIEIEGCTFKSKGASHPIRINEVEGYCSIRGNYVENGITGIFIGSTRNSIIRNVLIESNTVKNCNDESISLDCFGDNTGLCPVIAKSYVDSVTVDNNTRVSTIRLRYLYYVKSVSGGYNTNIVAADFLNPMKYLFIIANGSHKFSMFEPLSAEIIEYSGDSGINSTYEIKVKGSLPNLSSGDEVGFYAGYLNCTIKGNIIESAGNTISNPGHGISLWGGGYGCKLENNTIIGCNNGIQMNGFNSFGVYDPAMFNYSLYNSIHGNVIKDCMKALKVGAYYISTDYPYLKDAFTKVYGNTFSNNGLSDVTDTDNLLFANNIVDHSDFKFTRCTNKYIENNMVVESEFTEQQ